jgi:UDPglucose 6-dehydrogenase
MEKTLSEIDELFTIVSMPEFLAEGCAIQNLTYPERVVIGTPKTENGVKAFEIMSQFYKTQTTAKIINTR